MVFVRQLVSLQGQFSLEIKMFDASCYFLDNTKRNYTMNYEYCKKERADPILLKSKKVADFITSYYKHKITSGQWPTDDGRRTDMGSSDRLLSVG